MDHPAARKTLILLTAVNYLNYIDRYILAAVLVSIKSDLALSDFQAGLLATAFMVPYMFTAPIFGWLGDTRDRSKILSLGATVWSAATFITGMANHFYTAMISRFILGVGESAFTTTSVPYLSEFFKPEKRGRILAIFSSALPVGAALGYLLGGILGSTVGWRWAFYIVGFPGLILAFFIWKLGDPRKQNTGTKFDIKKVLKTLKKSKPYLWAVAGTCAYAFAVGGVAHWIPSYIQRTFALTELHANTMFGGIAVGSGLVGTLLGGYLGDRFQKQRKGGHLKIAAISMALAVPAFWFCLQAETVTSFVVALVFCQLFFFLPTSPMNVAVLESIPPAIRNSGVAVAIFAQHILGDAISAPLIGEFSDVTHSLKSGILICTPVILLSAIFWWMGSRTKHESHAAA